MATWSPTRDLPAPPQTRARLWPKILFGLLVLLAAAVGYAYYLAQKALPQLDGQLVLPALTAPVTVTRDPHGVPTIEAQSLTDLFTAQGYVTAQDRLWQLDIMRRFAAGEVSEVVGAVGVEHDREQRILGMRQLAAKAVAAMPTRDRAFMEAYAKGVNAFLSTHQDRLPIEFRLMGYKPAPWTSEDSILLGTQLVEDLNHGTYESALEREKILAKLGPELTADLYVNTSWRDRPPTMTPHRLSDEIEQLKKDTKDEDDDQEEMDDGPDSNIAHARPSVPSHWKRDPELIPGSNDWVVSGAHTVTGKPLLSNDMHLHHQMPNLWYEAHLHAGDYDVVGVTLPGLPFVIVGHNQRIAWGVTNVGPTVEELYVETFNDKGEYQAPQGWAQPEHRTETIHVKGASDVVLNVVTTRHGPIISDLIPGETRKLALRWTLYDSLFDPFFDVDSAKNWDEFRHALSLLDSPGQNFVYADVDGHIGYQTTGHVPIRKAGDDGTLPVPGNDDAHEWNGYIPFDKLPTVFDPPSGVIATANGRITPDGYAYNVSTEWEPPWRTERIYRVLESGKKLGAPDMLALQTDIYSAFDRLCAEHFVYALDHVKNPSKRAQQARELMRDWDGRLAIDSAAATIAVRSREELVRLILDPKLGSSPRGADAKRSENLEPLNWRTYRWHLSSVWLENVLQKKPRRWLPAQFADYDALLAAAVEAALSKPDAPADLAKWRWGKAHPIEIDHPVLGKIPELGRWAAPGIQEQSGGSFTVKSVGRSVGPSERYTADLSNFDHSTLNTVTGQGGNVLSPYYMDQWKAWYEGTTFVLPFSTEAVRAARAHQLVLEPK